VLLWENLDVRQLAPRIVLEPGPLPLPEPALSPAVQAGDFQAVILSTPRNRGFYPDSSYYQKTLEHWRELVAEVGGRVRFAGSVEELGELQAQEVLLVPEAPCLSEEEVSAVVRHLRNGGGVVSNWAVGARDEACEWRGWGTVADLTGAGDVRELSRREALYLTVPGGMALSPGLDPGTRIELRPEPSLALHVPGPRVYWSDWALNPAPDESGGGADVAALATRNESGGRVAWFGFHLSQAATARDSTNLEQLIRNGILWAAGRAFASVSPWPSGKRAALLLVEDVEAEHGNAAAMAELLRELELPGTFFAVSQLVMDDPELGRVLSEVGEVGSQTSDHNPVAGLSYQDQSVRLRRSWAEIRGWTGMAPAGLRPPEEAFDTNTLRAWADVGGQYVLAVLAVNQARSGSPEIHRFRNQDPVVLLPRLMKDDYNVFVQEGALRTERLTEAFLEGMEKLRAIGGLAVVAVHTQIVGTGRRLEAVRAAADAAVADGDWWVGTAADVSEWWKNRGEVGVTVQPGSVTGPAVTDPPAGGAPEGPSSGLESADSSALGLDFKVRALSQQAIEGVWIDIVLPGGAGGVVPSVDDLPVAHTRTDWGLRVPLGPLEAGVARVLSLVRADSLTSSQGGQ
jgi:peptidoglycan/xylan/chitin deacetylase (PgdA/CDA1 family)